MIGIERDMERLGEIKMIINGEHRHSFTWPDVALLESEFDSVEVIAWRAYQLGRLDEAEKISSLLSNKEMETI